MRKWSYLKPTVIAVIAIEALIIFILGNQAVLTQRRIALVKLFQGNQSSSTPKPLAKPTYAPSPIPTMPTEWKLYRNEVYGYELSYPSSWEAVEANPKAADWSDNNMTNDKLQQVTFKPQNSPYIGGRFEVSVLQVKSINTMDQLIQYFDVKLQYPVGIHEIRNLKDTKLCGTDAKQFNIFTPGVGSSIITALKSNYIYVLENYEFGSDDPNYEQIKKIYSIMSDSFRFL